MNSVEHVLELVAARGMDVEQIVVADKVDVVPPAPSHQWILLPMSDGTVTLGGMDRGSFAVYGKFSDPRVAAEALQKAEDLAPPLPADRPAKALVAGTQVLLDELRAISEDGADLGPEHFPVGTVLDHIGPRSGHVLYLFATPFEQRSLPPTDLNLARTGYVLAAPLPSSCGVGQVEPWFGQPGGGMMVTLDRVIAYYVDMGLLAPFSIDAVDPAPAGTDLPSQANR